MASIQAGSYTIQEILDHAGFDFRAKAAADYNNGEPDYRRVKVGGLSFDNLEKRINVPVTADELVITLDGKKAVALAVDLDDEQKKERAASFEAAADASDSRTS